MKNATPVISVAELGTYGAMKFCLLSLDMLVHGPSEVLDGQLLKCGCLIYIYVASILLNENLQIECAGTQ